MFQSPQTQPSIPQMPNSIPQMPTRAVVTFVIAPNTPLKELLPSQPKVKAQKASAFVGDLADVPEVMLAEPLPSTPPKKEAETLVHEDIKAIAHQIAKINHLNKEKADRFIEALLANRLDLAGLPFQMGDTCRLPSPGAAGTSAKRFALVHNTRAQSVRQPNGAPVPSNVSFPNFLIVDPATANAPASGVRSSNDDGSAFLSRFLQSCITSDDSMPLTRMKEQQEHVVPARLAAMTQICAPTSDSMKLALARYLASVSSVESTHALVKTILFTPEENARDVAIAALKARRDTDYSEALLQGFRYPWPEVAKRTADALVKLNRKDLIPAIIGELDGADPRAPFDVVKDSKSMPTVRELVRINHHRNCLMCHAPGENAANDENVLTAEVPLPNQSLPSFNGNGYRNQGFAQLLVRIDVTYLRQDFSVMLPVADAAPWPEMQRFDFVVRTRNTRAIVELQGIQGEVRQGSNRACCHRTIGRRCSRCAS